MVAVLSSLQANDGLDQFDIFVSGRGGYHTYRIPALAVSSQGTVLAFCEARKNSRKDHGDVDLVLRRSADGGQSWLPMQLVCEEGDVAPITIGNPCPVVDSHTGIIWLPFCRNNKDVFVTHSDDDGRTWSRPVNISSNVTRPAWKWVATGPGHGIQLTSGRVLPCDHSFYLHGDQRRGPAAHSHVFFSDDHGKTWQLGGITKKSMHECQVIQYTDDSLLLSMRNYTGRERRAFSTSHDEGQTWTEPKHHEEVYCPVCQAGLLRLDVDNSASKDVILYSGPGGPGRNRLTIRRSTDGGQTWSVDRVLHQGPAAYSDLAILPDQRVGCLYERGNAHPYEKITFARLRIDSVTK